MLTRSDSDKRKIVEYFYRTAYKKNWQTSQTQSKANQILTGLQATDVKSQRIARGKYRHLFSVIIPTTNRSTLLEKSLTFLAAQKYPPEFFEVIVVSNDSLDTKTKRVVEQKRKLFKNFTYLVEPRRGMSFARNTGAGKAKFGHLVFIDDDICVKPDFLNGYDAAWRKYPNAKILGGSIYSELAGGESMSVKLRQMLKKYAWCFGQKTSGDIDSVLDVRDCLFSANMSYDNTDHDLEFSSNLGVITNNKLIGAEDYELCLRTTMSLHKVIFVSDSAVSVRHLVSKARFTRRYLLNRHRNGGVEISILEKLIKKNFENFNSFYFKDMMSLKGVKLLFTDECERTKFFKYLNHRFGLSI